jgi:hypothetical protein
MLAYLRLTAPFDGIVTERYLHQARCWARTPARWFISSRTAAYGWWSLSPRATAAVL